MNSSTPRQPYVKGRTNIWFSFTIPFEEAVDSVHDEGLFHFHENPNPDCPIGRNIHKAMDSKLERVQECMEEEMRKITLADVMTDIQSELKEN